MFTQVNSTSGVLKTLAKPNRLNNLLSVALNRMSGGLRADRSREDAEKPDISSYQNRDVSGIRQLPTIAFDAFGAEHSDKIVASVSGMARMIGMVEKATNLRAIDPEGPGDRLVKAKNEIIQNSASALEAQANQSPNFVMKLLE